MKTLALVLFMIALSPAPATAHPARPPLGPPQVRWCPMLAMCFPLPWRQPLPPPPPIGCPANAMCAPLPSPTPAGR